MSVKTIRSLTRGLETLEAIAAHQPIGLTDLVTATGEDKSALQRTLATLHEAGWIRPSSDAPPRWELGAKPLVISSQARQATSLTDRARQLLAPLRDQTGETVHLALLDGSTIVVADVAEGTQPVRTALPIGQIHPVESSSSGRAILSHLGPSQRSALVTEPEKMLTPAELDDIRERGWAPSAGAVLEGSNSVGAAILDPTGAPIGAVVISGPSTRMTTQRVAELGDALTHALRSL